MKLTQSVLSLGLLFALAPLVTESDVPARETIVFDDFSSDVVGEFPINWRWRKNRDTGDADKAREDGVDVFRWMIEEEDGNRYLHIRDEHRPGHSVSVFMEPKDWDLRENRILRWRWRVNEVPPGADERYTETNDMAASVAVVYKTGFLNLSPHVIRWMWSSTLPVGAVSYRAGRGRPYSIVVGTGDVGAGEWVTIERDLVDDYLAIFGETPPDKPKAIVLASDANRTPGGAADADYDDIQALADWSEGFPKAPLTLDKEYMKENN
jgi:hypothetical protein